MNLTPASNQRLTLEWTDEAGTKNKLTGLAHTTSMGGAGYGMTNIELEVSDVKIEQTEDSTLAQLDEVDSTRPEVSRTASIVLKELTVVNLLDAHDLSGAPEEASVDILPQTFGGFKVVFRWTD